MIRTGRLLAFFFTIALFALTEPLKGEDSLPPEKIAALKSATVYVVVTLDDRQGSGSGFVVKTIGNETYVVTNDHVINIEHGLMARGLEPSNKFKPTIKVVFGSGTLNEQSATAIIVAADPERDLAVLKVSGLKEPPAPIDLSEPAKLIELMPLTICGYPLGKSTAIEDQNPSSTINALTISNIRTNLKTGRIQDIQVNGGMTHGNSGGPIVASADGKLVGVAVSGFGGTQIGYAIPSDEVRRVLAGTHGRIRIIPEKPDAAGDGPAQLRISLVDPFKTIKGMTAYVAATLPEAKGPLVGIMPDAKKVPLTISDGLATATITAPAKGKQFVQVEVELDGGKQLGVPIEVASGIPVAVNVIEEWTAKSIAPEPKKMAPDLRTHGPQDKAHPFPGDAKKAMDLRKAAKQWYADQITKPIMGKSTAKSANYAKLKSAVDASVAYYQNVAVFPRRSGYLEPYQAAVADLYGVGNRTPAIKLFNLLRADNPDPLAAQLNALSEYISQMEKRGDTPFLQVLAAYHRANYLLAMKDSSRTNDLVAAYITAIKKLGELAKDSNASAGLVVRNLADQIQTDYVQAGWGRDNGYDEIAKALKESDAPQALRHTIKGEYLLKSAEFLAAKKETDKAMSFGKEAQAEFEAAWEADKNCDTAAAGMIGVCRLLKLDRSVMESWFKRALTVNPGCYAACEAKLKYLDPEGRGRNPEALAFGRQCLRSNRNIAGIPYILVQAYGNITIAPGSPFVASLAEDAITWADIREYYEKSIALSAFDRTILTEYAVLCAGAKQWIAAKRCLMALENRPAASVFKKTSDFTAFVKTVDDNLKASMLK